MSSLTAVRAKELLPLIVQGGNPEALIELIAGMTEPRGDPLKVAIRNQVLKDLYCQTRDCEDHCKDFVGDDELSQTSASLS